MDVYHADFRKLENQARFIQEIIDNEMKIGKKRKDVLVAELRSRKYEAFPRGNNNKKKTNDEGEEEDGEADGGDTQMDGGARDYDYLLSVS